MYVIIPGYVPVVGRYLQVHFFVWVERKGREIHLFTGCLGPRHVSC